MTNTCKHCGLGIAGLRGNWIHTEGPQHGKHRCALNPYGYDAAPHVEPCDVDCNGYKRSDSDH